jgi:TPR repeat protein
VNIDDSFIDVRQSLENRFEETLDYHNEAKSKGIGIKNVLERFKTLAEAGHEGSKLEYAKLCIEIGEKASFKEARGHLKDLAKAGNFEGTFLYAKMCENGLGGPSNLYEAKDYYQKLLKAENPDPVIRKQYSKVCIKMGGEDNLKEAKEQLKILAELGDASSQITYPKLCIDMGGRKNFEEGLSYLKKMANEGHTESQISCAEIFQKGLKVPKNLYLAKDYYQKAGYKKDFNNLLNYAEICKELGGKENLEEAQKNSPTSI